MPKTEHVKTAVIAAAGSATRMWPASKAIPKELFPLGRAPAIVRIVAELVDAGISRVILVVSSRGCDLMQALFDVSIAPPASVAADPAVKRFQALLANAEIRVEVQSGNYGNATPLIQMAGLIGSQPCIYGFGDDVVLGENVTERLIQLYETTGYPILAAQEVAPARKTQFGILECVKRNGIQCVSRLLEKPTREQTPSNLASFGRYLVTPELLRGLLRQRPGRNNEIWFTDSVIEHLNQGLPIGVVTLSKGKWYTVGDPLSYAEAVAAACDEETET